MALAHDSVGDDKSLSIIVTSNLTAEVDTQFGDTKEGSFALRITPTMRHKGNVAKGHLANSEGHVDGDVWGKRAKWLRLEGQKEQETESMQSLFRGLMVALIAMFSPPPSRTSHIPSSPTTSYGTSARTRYDSMSSRVRMLLVVLAQGARELARPEDCVLACAVCV